MQNQQPSKKFAIKIDHAGSASAEQTNSLAFVDALRQWDETGYHERLILTHKDFYVNIGSSNVALGVKKDIEVILYQLTDLEHKGKAWMDLIVDGTPYNGWYYVNKISASLGGDAEATIGHNKIGAAAEATLTFAVEYAQNLEQGSYDHKLEVTAKVSVGKILANPLNTADSPSTTLAKLMALLPIGSEIVFTSRLNDKRTTMIKNIEIKHARPTRTCFSAEAPPAEFIIMAHPETFASIASPEYRSSSQAGKYYDLVHKKKDIETLIYNLEREYAEQYKQISALYPNISMPTQNIKHREAFPTDEAYLQHLCEQYIVLDGILKDTVKSEVNSPSKLKRTPEEQQKYLINLMDHVNAIGVIASELSELFPSNRPLKHMARACTVASRLTESCLKIAAGKLSTSLLTLDIASSILAAVNFGVSLFSQSQPDAYLCMLKRIDDKLNTIHHDMIVGFETTLEMLSILKIDIQKNRQLQANYHEQLFSEISTIKKALEEVLRNTNDISLKIDRLIDINIRIGHENAYRNVSRVLQSVERNIKPTDIYADLQILYNFIASDRINLPVTPSEMQLCLPEYNNYLTELNIKLPFGLIDLRYWNEIYTQGYLVVLNRYREDIAFTMNQNPKNDFFIPGLVEKCHEAQSFIIKIYQEPMIWEKLLEKYTAEWNSILSHLTQSPDSPLLQLQSDELLSLKSQTIEQRNALAKNILQKTCQLNKVWVRNVRARQYIAQKFPNNSAQGLAYDFIDTNRNSPPGEAHIDEIIADKGLLDALSEPHILFSLQTNSAALKIYSESLSTTSPCSHGKRVIKQHGQNVNHQAGSQPVTCVTRCYLFSLSFPAPEATTIVDLYIKNITQFPDTCVGLQAAFPNELNQTFEYQKNAVKLSALITDISSISYESAITIAQQCSTKIRKGILQERAARFDETSTRLRKFNEEHRKISSFISLIDSQILANPVQNALDACIATDSIDALRALYHFPYWSHIMGRHPIFNKAHITLSSAAPTPNTSDSFTQRLEYLIAAQIPYRVSNFMFDIESLFMQCDAIVLPYDEQVLSNYFQQLEIFKTESYDRNIPSNRSDRIIYKQHINRLPAPLKASFETLKASHHTLSQTIIKLNTHLAQLCSCINLLRDLTNSAQNHVSLTPLNTFSSTSFTLYPTQNDSLFDDLERFALYKKAVTISLQQTYPAFRNQYFNYFKQVVFLLIRQLSQQITLDEFNNNHPICKTMQDAIEELKQYQELCCRNDISDQLAIDEANDQVSDSIIEDSSEIKAQASSQNYAQNQSNFWNQTTTTIAVVSAVAAVSTVAAYCLMKRR